jgi:hypothetical protein
MFVEELCNIFKWSWPLNLATTSHFSIDYSTSKLTPKKKNVLLSEKGIRIMMEVTAKYC